MMQVSALADGVGRSSGGAAVHPADLSTDRPVPRAKTEPNAHKTNLFSRPPVDVRFVGGRAETVMVQRSLPLCMLRVLFDSNPMHWCIILIRWASQDKMARRTPTQAHRTCVIDLSDFPFKLSQ